MFLEAESLKKLIKERPELPIVFLCDESIWSEAHGEGGEIWPATGMIARIGKVLSMKDNDTFMRTFTDEDEDDLECEIRYYLDMSDEAQGITDEEYEKMVEKELDYYKPHWKECIIVELGV